MRVLRFVEVIKTKNSSPILARLGRCISRLNDRVNSFDPGNRAEIFHMNRRQNSSR